MKKKKIMCIFIVLLIVLAASIIIFNIPKESKLKKIGYNDKEIKIINKLSEKEISVIENNKYNKNTTKIVKYELYYKDKLDDYIKYTNKYNNISYLKIMNLINNESFEKDNIDKYIEAYKYCDSAMVIIYAVNADYPVDELTLGLVGEKFFIDDFYERYIAYYENNKDLNYNEIVKRINANLDYTFYTDSEKADLSKGMYTLVNKFNYLDKDYVPDNLETITGSYARDTAYLVKDAYDAFIKMVDAAKDEGLTIKITTGYRSYSFQSTLYYNYVNRDGKELADTYSARPGYSEHQLGYSADLTNKDLVSFDEFENTDEYKWLQKNAYKYGFIQRYPKDKEHLTGFMYESWHYRYVGLDIAKYIYTNNMTYEEYYSYFLR